MSKEIRDIFTDIGIATVVLVIALPLLYKGGCEPNSEPKSEPKSDTIYIHDTIRIVEPISISEEVVDEEVVKLPVSELKGELKSELKDSARLINEVSKVAPDTNAATKTAIEDSVAVIVPITQKVYEDSTYKAVVRGYNPELVSLDLYNTTKYYPVVERVKVKPIVTLSAGVYGGIGQKGADYGFGIMVGVPIWSW